MFRPFHLPIAALLLAATVPAQAQAPAEETQAHASLLAAAEAHVLERADQFDGDVSVSASPLDRRLRLAKCSVPLQTYESPNGLKPGRSVVGIRCEGNKPWKLFVSVNIAILQQVVVATRPLARGELVTADDLALVEQDISRLHRGYYQAIEQASGLRTKRQIAAGKVVTPGALARDRLVKRGSDVEILAQSGGLQVRMRGKAMSHGARGERIRVRNLASGRIISGTVIDAGMILVQQ